MLLQLHSRFTEAHLIAQEAVHYRRMADEEKSFQSWGSFMQSARNALREVAKIPSEEEDIPNNAATETEAADNATNEEEAAPIAGAEEEAAGITEDEEAAGGDDGFDINNSTHTTKVIEGLRI